MHDLELEILTTLQFDFDFDFPFDYVEVFFRSGQTETNKEKVHKICYA